jgi:formate dehydrogenase subunit gamma
MHAATYIPLAITGFMIMAPAVKAIVSGDPGMGVRVLHRFFAIAFGILPILYVVLQPRRFLMNVRENLTFGKEDIGWVKAAIPYYIYGRHENMPPQPRFNTGERLNAAMIMIGTVLFGITGFTMWFGRGVVPPWLFRTAVIIHDLTMIVTFMMFIVHFLLAVIHPLMWQSLISMRYGVVSESYAREHHAIWYYGKKRAMEMWEQRQTEGGH